ncbi:poly [ADP-ribose] polymerase 14, partial [Biomphalaria glabrata]
MSAPTRKLKADGLPSDITEIRLKTFFSNENSQGGGPVEDVQISEDRTSAIITFNEVKAVDRIIKRRETVSMSSVFVKVSPYFDEIPHDCNDNLADEIKAIKSKALEPEKSQEANNKITTANIVKQKAVFSCKDLNPENLSAKVFFRSKTLSPENEISNDISSKSLSSENVISKDISSKNLSSENVLSKDISCSDLISKNLRSKDLSSDDCQHLHTITSQDLNANDKKISNERQVAADTLIHK